MVVSDRSTGGERIAQPVAVFGADGVGVIGESRRAFVGGDDEIWIVGIVPHHVFARHDFAFDQVIGDIQ